jgi:methionyl-tRNA synthetase
MNLARRANKYFNDSEPWETAKKNQAQCATTLNISLQLIRALAILLEPVIPAMSRSMWTMLNLEGTPVGSGWDTAGQMVLADGHRLGKSEILVAKIDDKRLEEVMQKLLGQQASGLKAAAKMKPTISVDDFKKLDLRVAKVLSAEKVAKSDKLLKMQLDIGGETRQVLAGIAQHYQPQDLVNKSLVIVANLQPAKLMGQESQGMILAASNDEGQLSVICPIVDISPGSIVK